MRLSLPTQKAFTSELRLVVRGVLFLEPHSLRELAFFDRVSSPDCVFRTNLSSTGTKLNQQPAVIRVSVSRDSKKDTERVMVFHVASPT